MNIYIDHEVYDSYEYFIATIAEDHLEGDPWYNKSFMDVDHWCYDTFGSQDLWGEDPVTGWKRMRNRYFFTEQKKLDWFMVKWS